jgi:hypothetical protein
MSRKCMFKFFGVLGAGVGSHVASLMDKGANASDWQALSMVLYGACIGMIVAWIVSMGMKKDDCSDSKSCKK